MTKPTDRKYSNLQIWLTLFTGGPFVAGVMIFRNLRSTNKTWALLALFGGSLVTLLMYLLLNFITGRWKESMANGPNGRPQLLGLMVLSLLVVQGILAFLYLLYQAYVKRVKLMNQHRAILRDNQKRNITGLVITGLGLSVIYLLSGFFFSFLVIYLLPNVYLFYRLKKIVNHERYWHFISIIYIILIILYPFSEIAYHFTYVFPVKAALFVSYYYLPALLYYFLIMVLIDLTLLINRGIKIIPVDFLKKSKTRKVTFSIVTILVIGIVIYGRLNYIRPVVDSYKVDVPKKAGDLEKLTIAVASDFHLNAFTRKDMVKRIVAAINSTHPDLVLIVGDVMDTDNEWVYRRTYQQDFKELHPRFGVYAATGNHEYYGNYEKRIGFMRNSNMTLLLDSVVYIDSAFYLAGRKDRYVKDREKLKDIIAGIDTTKPLVLMDHQPVGLEDAWNNGVDIQVSGHTHDGQLFPFNYITDMVYQLSWGHKKIHSTDFFVSCGIQGWGPKLKTAGRAEVMEIQVSFK